MINFTSRRFSIALSFPSEYRPFVEKLADNLANAVSTERVLYDKYCEAEFARLDLDTYLPNLYRNQSELVVIFLCPEYNDKRWCKLEWRFIKQLIVTPDQHKIMLLSFVEDKTVVRRSDGGIKTTKKGGLNRSPLVCSKRGILLLSENIAMCSSLGIPMNPTDRTDVMATVVPVGRRPTFR